ncbi:protein artichoke-like [Plodia interpunctella]|uniref:protein artichoke-like n=1 Tax=Plodia interpunctella TaxID=58824 RepID=UPI002368C28E|nr:protein artichoke-like [Plodia interpunctella]XP_053603951.1 protein artichoke-like [Plodia interpunctella]
MKEILCFGTEKNYGDVWKIVSLLLFLPAILRAQNTLGCTDLIRSNKCSCYTSEEGLFLDCQDTVLKDVKNALKKASLIHSLSIFDLDDNEENLGPHFIPQGVCIKHIHISRTSIRDIADDTFMPLRKCLETLGIVSSKIKFIPQKAFSGMLKLMSIDLTSNYIEDIPSYSFYGLPLMKLNIKGNVIRDISDSAFSSLELSLSEIDLSENNLTAFPIASLSKLRHLRTLRLAWNEMSSFPIVENSDLIALEYLDLNSNNFEFISEDCLKFCPSLVRLSFHFNFIHNIHYRAFYSLAELKNIDLSHNRIKILNPNLFHNNKKIEYIDLSHNHLHHIHGLFSNLPSLGEVYLSHNNILDVPIDSFFNSYKISSIYLDKNSISNIHSESFSNLMNLTKLRLDFNYLHQVPHNIFVNNRNIVKIRVDNNNFIDISNNTLDSLGNLREIRLNNNKLRLISKHHFTNSLKLEEIYLNNNEITFIEAGTFIKMSNLKLLNLQHNNLVDFNDVLPKLRSNLLTLHLDYNNLSLLSAFMFLSQEKLNHLSLKYNNLKFITRNIFRNLSHITRLELNHNEFSIIDDFSFQHLNLTRYLNLQNNLIRNITNYTFFGLSELEDLDISCNRIYFVFDMAFDSLKKLRSLNLSFNPLQILQKNIFQQGLPLSSLYLDNCEIQLIENDTFQGLNNLKILSIKNNSLRASDLLSINIPGLKHLYLSFNILDYLPLKSFYQLPLLEFLYLEHCNIEHIIEGTFKNNKNLLRLNIAQNIISSIPIKLFDVHNSISEFNISNNFLDYVPYNTLHNFTQIEVLDIADNLLPRIELSGLESLTKLKYLILRKNEIKSITSRKKVEFTELIAFDVSFNRLDHLPTVIFEIFPNIQNLNISHNDIIYFDFLMTYKKNKISLVNIDISKNPAVSWTSNHRADNNTLVANLYELHICATNITNVDDITFEFFTSLQHLYLKFNKIRRLSISPFSKLNILENLDLSYNRISQLKASNFRGLTKLRTLCLSNNNIESMESFAEDLGNLKLLDLSHNKLQNILNEDLINLKELSVLHLSYNNIKYISVTAFRNLNKVIKIDLDHNKLQAIPIELLSSVENHVQDISIKDNILICNCQKDNTWIWIQDHPKIIKSNTVTCLNDDYPKEKCDVPIISQLSVDKHKDNSVSVSWFIRNRTAIKALQILYYGEDVSSEVKSKYLDANEVSTRLTDLDQNANYVVCVITLYDDPVITVEDFEYNKTADINLNITARITQDIAAAILMQSPSSECISFNTIKEKTTGKTKIVKPFDISQILNRRMGLIVGCSLGFVVFFIMVTVLLYTKIKERKRIAKSDPTWREMNDYHSMQSKEDILQHSTTASTDNILLGMTKNRKHSIDHLK